MVPPRSTLLLASLVILVASVPSAAARADVELMAGQMSVPLAAQD